jgi:RNA polymerase sigma-70 factor (ECF subfamily)
LKDEIPQLREARQRFNQEIEQLRPELHRFCTRMMGSVSEGEDAVQDTLMHAFYRLPDLREGTSLRAWLFRIAHNRCIDLLRRRKAFLPLDEEVAMAEGDPSFERRQLAQSTLAAIFTQLPARERASVVLKDVLGYSLEEAAEITGASVGAIKAAIHRAREKLERLKNDDHAVALSEQHRQVVERYVDRFNARDWDGVRALLGKDARLEVVQFREGPFEGPYFTNYAQLPWQWRLGLAEVEGLPAVVHYKQTAAGWQPHSVIVFNVEGDRVTLVRDYVHIDYLLQGAQVSERT